MPSGKGNHPGKNTTYRSSIAGPDVTPIGRSGAETEAWNRATTGDYGGFGSLARSNTGDKEYMSFARNQLKKRDSDANKERRRNVAGNKD